MKNKITLLIKNFNQYSLFKEFKTYNKNSFQHSENVECKCVERINFSLQINSFKMNIVSERKCFNSITYKNNKLQ